MSPPESQPPSSEKPQPDPNIRDEPVRVPRSAEDMLKGRDEGRIAEASPEGIPADPGLRAKGIVMLFGGMVLLVIVVSIVAGVVWGSSAGWGVLMVGMLVAFLSNSVFYASILRAKEREKVLHDR
jgi:hypothetical protein